MLRYFWKWEHVIKRFTKRDLGLSEEQKLFDWHCIPYISSVYLIWKSVIRIYLRITYFIYVIPFPVIIGTTVRDIVFVFNGQNYCLNIIRASIDNMDRMTDYYYEISEFPLVYLLLRLLIKMIFCEWKCVILWS